MSPINLSNLLEFLYNLNIFENGYNLLNTITYSLLGIIIYFFIVYPYLVLRKIKINFNFVLSVIIFVIIGSILRMLSFDFLSFERIITPSTNPLSIGFYFYYPNLFIFLALLYLLIFESSIFLSKKYNLDFQKLMLYISLTLLFPLFLFLIINLVNWVIFFKILFFSSIIFLILFYVFKKIKLTLLSSKISQFAFFSQVLDSFTTFFAISFLKNQFIEKHVLSHFIISINPLLFLFIKIFFCLFLLFLIDRYIKENNLNNYFKLFIIIIGLSTGLRNLFLISLLLL